MDKAVVVRAHGHTRSTQSFVYLMGSVWRRPSLSGLEILWRWLAGVPLLALLAWWGLQHLSALQTALVSLETISAFHPLEAVTTLHAVLGGLWRTGAAPLMWFVPLATLWWAAAGAVGQNVVARRMEPSMQWAAGALFVQRLVRLLGVGACLAVWTMVVRFAASVALTKPAAEHREPSVLLLLAIVIVASILLFVLWAGVSWPLELAQTVALRDGVSAPRALREALRSRVVSGQVLEVNLVLCIVRIALLVLAMVFSACPLPFQSVATPEFLVVWTSVVALWYLAMSDYFHVVRMAAYAALEAVAQGA